MINKIEPIIFTKPCKVTKGWGFEEQIINNVVLSDEPFPFGYSGKFLVYNQKGAKSSFHFHHIKHETFRIFAGEFQFNYYDLESGNQLSKNLFVGDVVVIPPGNPHQLISLSGYCIVIEFASTDYTWDNYRIGKGDSQTKTTTRPCGCPNRGFNKIQHEGITKLLEASIEYAKKQQAKLADATLGACGKLI